MKNPLMDAIIERVAQKLVEQTQTEVQQSVTPAVDVNALAQQLLNQYQSSEVTQSTSESVAHVKASSGC